MDSKNNLLQGNHAALWHGRFSEGPDRDAVEFETSIYVDSRMALDDIAGSIAHVKMLGARGIISMEESLKIQSALEEIKNEICSGKLAIDNSAEDIHSFIEAVLTDRLGDTGRKLHTGRSRNDQIALDERLYLRRVIPDLQNEIKKLVKTLKHIAEQHLDTLLSGYTHMQRAQPVSLAHHLCAWIWPLIRDYERLSDALGRIDYSPLGAGALAGSGLPLDRELTAEILGFSGVTPNSLDTVCDRDYCIEFVSDFSLIMTHLSRYCEEVILWSTEEFKFINLSEKWSTGSSIMPQKKNPDFAELIRGRTGLVFGNLMALLTMMKGLPLSYNRDLQEDKTSLFAAFDTVSSCIRVFTSMIQTASWNKEKMKASCYGGYANATDLADYLVKKGIPFRKAHEYSASCVKLAIEKKLNLEDLSLEDLKNICPVIEEDVFDILPPEHCKEARQTTGGPANSKVTEQLELIENWLKN